MKKLVIFIFIFFCFGCSSPFDNLRDEHIVYEGTIENYMSGPIARSKQEIVMELWFAKQDFIHGYWKSKGANTKHYLKGELTTLRQMYGSDARNQRKEDNQQFGYVTNGKGMLWFKEMSGSNAKYRIRLTEYSDEHFSKMGENAFYIYNFEDGKLQGSYHSFIAHHITDGKDEWSTAFSTLFHLKRTN